MYETNPSLSSLKVSTNFCDYCDSYLPIEPDSTIDTPLTDLEEVFNPPLTSLTFVVPSFSSTPIVTIVSNLTLFASPFFLIPCMELKIGEPYRTDAITIEDDLFHWSKKHTLIESYITEAPFEKLCSDDVMVTARLRIGHANFICTESLHLTPIPLFYKPL